MSYTNTRLATFRRCKREHYLAYELLLDNEATAEHLVVGDSWHKSFELADAYAAIDATAPGRLWREKLRRLRAAYDWKWGDDGLEIIEPERQFRVEINGITYEGKTDGVGRFVGDEREGLIERKTTSDDVGPVSFYWHKLRLDTQVGLYGLAFGGQYPSFILYDVVRKPTISPKRLTKAELARIKKDMKVHGAFEFYRETFGEDVARIALETGRETIELYGARLTHDIGERSGFYFARQTVPRTSADYETLAADLEAEVQFIEHARKIGHHPRNPDACNAFGTCRFFGLCSTNRLPKPDEQPPEGFIRRSKLHPELA